MATHTSPFSGNWYPRDPVELQELTGELFRAAERRCVPVRPGGIAFIVPHAGLQYSGAVAASVYRHLEAQRPRRILLLGFPHHGAPSGLWLPDIEAIRTPLGVVEVDTTTVGELAAHPEFHRMQEAILCDHSIEIQLPLIQRAVPGARIVPIYASHPSPAIRESAGRTLASMLDSDTVLVASTDLTHFGRSFRFQPFPVDDYVGERLRELDESVIEAIGSLSPEFFYDTLRETSATVCGFEPVAVLLSALKHWQSEGGLEEVFLETLDYQTSGEITGDFSHSVSYGALGFFPYRSFLVDEEDGLVLLECARRTLEYYQRTGRRELERPPVERECLARRGGVFVSLHNQGVLRGCIGQCEPCSTIRDCVPEMTLSAALEDCRFDPVSPHEEGIDIEISLLSPLKRIVDLKQFKVNEHGAVLKSGVHRALLLPQVATERNWEASQFLEALARKAGAGRFVYDDPKTSVYVFRAQVIS